MIGFVILALVALASAILVVASRNPIESALWLALTLAAVAGLFIVLDAQFLAAIQLVVYAGAILVFFLFVIMLLNLGQLPTGQPRQAQRSLGLFFAVLILGVLGFAIQNAGLGGPAPAGLVTGIGNTEAVATLMYSKYLFAVEITSVLLTAAVVGAVVLAKKREA